MAGLIPQDFINDLVDRADIVEVIGRRVSLKKAGKEFKACCPFHDEKTPSFTVVPNRGFYHCFGCGAHGTAISFLMEFEHMDFVGAVEALAAMMGVEVPRADGDRPAQRYDALFAVLGKAQNFWQQTLRETPSAVEYLRGRGIDGATAQRFGIGYAPEGWSTLAERFGASEADEEQLLAAGLVIRKDTGRHYDRFRDRIMFPIRDARGRCIGFGGRVIGDGAPKYLNSPETVLFHKGRELYGLWEARQALRQIDRLVVVEGYMDVVALARHGIEFAVATLGTATTAEHLNRLFRLTENVVFCFDGDAAGRKAAWRALETTLPHLREGRQVRFVFLPDPHDPDSFVNKFGADAFVTLIDSSVPLSEFLLGELESRSDGTVDGRARLAEQAKPLVARIPPGVYRDLLLRSLADRVGLSPDRLGRNIDAGVRDDRSGGMHARTSTRDKHRTAASNHGRPSVVRRAITLLLNHPRAAASLDVEKLAGLSRPGIEVLERLIETVQRDPDISTAGLLERWRNDEAGSYLGRLAAVELPAGDDFDPAAELHECFDQLAAAGRREHVEILIEKQRVGTLSEDEKAELRQLM
jgi:DNA primase